MSVRERRNRKDRRAKTPEQLQRSFRRHERALITTTYACGHTQPEQALNLSGWGVCRVCDAFRAVTSTQAQG